MLQGVYSQNRIRQNFAPQQNLGIITPTRAQYPQFKEISPEANSAICAYMSPVINRDTVPQIPLKAMINRLKMQGKIEGKDFIVKKSQNGKYSEIRDFIQGDSPLAAQVPIPNKVCNLIFQIQAYKLIESVKYKFEGR